MVPTAIITSPIAAHHCDYPSSHRQIIIVIMIIAMIIMLIQIVIVTIMPMMIGGAIILASVGEVAQIMRGRWAEKEQVRSLALTLLRILLPHFLPLRIPSALKD